MGGCVSHTQLPEGVAPARRQVKVLPRGALASWTPALLPSCPPALLPTLSLIHAPCLCPSASGPRWSRFGGIEALSDDLVLSQRLQERDMRRLYGHNDRSSVGFVRKPTAAQLRRTHAHMNSRSSAFQGQEKQLKIRG